MLPFYLAVSSDAGDIITDSQNVGKAVQYALRDTWTELLQGQLFVVLCNTGAIVLVLCLLFWSLQWIRITYSPGDTKALGASVETMVIAFMVMLLLGTPQDRGKLLGGLSLASHDVFVGVGDSIVSTISTSVNNDVTAEAALKSTIEAQIPVTLQRCAAIDDVKKRDFCLQRADDAIKAQTDKVGQTAWAEQLYDKFHQAIQSAISADSQDAWDPLGDLQNGVNGYIGALSEAATLGLIRIFLLSMASAFFVILEHSMILTTLVCPIFIGFSYVSVTLEPLLGWVVAYFSIGSALIFYKILLGVVSYTILKSPPNEILLYPLTLTIFGIPLTLILCGGGGLMIFGSAARSLNLKR